MVYLLFKNKKSGEWEFPTSPVYVGERFLAARSRLMDMMTETFAVQHIGMSPQVHTLRNFTPDETKDIMNSEMLGVRTYYFLAFHSRGIPDLDFSTLPFSQTAWVPKSKMQDYLTEGRWEAFKDSLETR